MLLLQDGRGGGQLCSYHSSQGKLTRVWGRHVNHRQLYWLGKMAANIQTIRIRAPNMLPALGSLPDAGHICQHQAQTPRGATLSHQGIFVIRTEKQKEHLAKAQVWMPQRLAPQHLGGPPGKVKVGSKPSIEAVSCLSISQVEPS